MEKRFIEFCLYNSSAYSESGPAESVCDKLKFLECIEFKDPMHFSIGGAMLDF